MDIEFVPRRLSKFISDAASLSHRACRRAMARGEISIAKPGGIEQRAESLGEYVFAEDRVWLGGELLAVTPASVYIVLNKPMGVISTLSDPSGRRCLAEWVNELPAGVFPVGRLDRDTTGVLLLTDDGDLSYMMLGPRFHVEKTYRLDVRGEVSEQDERLELLRAGVDLGDGKPAARALSACVVRSECDSSSVEVIIDEGRYRQVRKMSRRVRFYLEHLERTKFGPLELGELERGDTRALDADEVDALWEICGGRDLPTRRAIGALARHARRWRAEGRPHERVEAWLAAWRDEHGSLPVFEDQAREWDTEGETGA